MIRRFQIKPLKRKGFVASCLLASALLMGAGSFARADGFLCATPEGDLRVDAFNHVYPSQGVRTAAVMVVWDPRIQYGNQLIARFRADKENLSSIGATYIGEVDLRLNGTDRGGEYISGTRLMYLDAMILEVDFSYGRPLRHGDRTRAALMLIKSRGEKIVRNMDCIRYLKAG